MILAGVVSLGLAAGVIAVVTVGVGGRYTDKNAKFTEFANLAVDHLNGDAEPPRKFTELVNR